MTTKVPYHNIVRVVHRPHPATINPEEPVDGTGRVNFKIHVEDSPLLAGHSKPGSTFRNCDGKLHQKETLTRFG